MFVPSTDRRGRSLGVQTLKLIMFGAEHVWLRLTHSSHAWSSSSAEHTMEMVDKGGGEQQGLPVQLARCQPRPVLLSVDFVPYAGKLVAIDCDHSPCLPRLLAERWGGGEVAMSIKQAVWQDKRP